MTVAPITAAGTGSSVLVEQCQVCGSTELKAALFLGYMPPVNQMRDVGQRPVEQASYPAELLYCTKCSLVQLGLIVDPTILFPADYPYTSGMTRILHENFEDLAQECRELLSLTADNLVVDIGSNDGTLLSKFQAQGHRVQGIEPTDAGDLAVAAGIPTTKAFFSQNTAAVVKARVGSAMLVTAANVFAHIEDVHAIINGVLEVLDQHGVFVTESHYVMSLLEQCQYDTVYHEHLRYYSVGSLRNLLRMHGLEIIHVRKIPTHGGSIRVYAAREGERPIQDSVGLILDQEQGRGDPLQQLTAFRSEVSKSKIGLYAILHDIRSSGGRVYGIGAPSRASTLVNYVGLDESMIECVLELPGSHKLGKYRPGTLIPVEEERRLFLDPPDYALILSWHIADELMPKLSAKGFMGDYIVPLPTPRIVRAG
jgi:hypothetical protein